MSSNTYLSVEKSVRKYFYRENRGWLKAMQCEETECEEPCCEHETCFHR